MHEPIAIQAPRQRHRHIRGRGQALDTRVLGIVPAAAHKYQTR